MDTLVDGTIRPIEETTRCPARPSPSSQGRPATNQCVGRGSITGNFPNDWTRTAAATLHVNWYNLTTEELNNKTESETGRVRAPNALDAATYSFRAAPIDAAAKSIRTIFGGHKDRVLANMTIWVGNGVLPPRPAFAAITIGHTVFWDGAYTGDAFVALMSHEYIHVLQTENGGFINLGSYVWNDVAQAVQRQEGSGPRNQSEAIGYLWEGWINAFRVYGAKPSWCYFKPTSGTVAGC